MPADENKALARRYIEGFWSQGSVPAEELLAPDYVVHDPGTPGRTGGVEGERQVATMYRTVFADLRFSV
jgi:SnoaL-like polyketide cyclase